MDADEILVDISSSRSVRQNDSVSNMTCRPRCFFSNVFKARNDVIVEAVVYAVGVAERASSLFTLSGFAHAHGH